MEHKAEESIENDPSTVPEGPTSDERSNRFLRRGTIGPRTRSQTQREAERIAQLEQQQKAANETTANAQQPDLQQILSSLNGLQNIPVLIQTTQQTITQQQQTI